MLKINWKLEITHLIIILGMFVAGFVLWESAPEKFPVHWNLEGKIDRYGSKFEGLFILPMIVTGLYGLLFVVPFIDPKKMNYQSFGGVFELIRFGTTLLMATVYSAAVFAAFGYNVDIGLIVGGGVGLFFILIGNYIGKIRPNWFVGIRTPWTLSSRLSWDKTHQVSGWWFVLSGLGIAGLSLVRTTWMLAGVLIFSIGGAIALTYYSYHVWKHDKERIPALESNPATEKEIEAEESNTSENRDL